MCSNVLPATGPVSARGDQSSDIETFRSYLRDELGLHDSCGMWQFPVSVDDPGLIQDPAASLAPASVAIHTRS